MDAANRPTHCLLLPNTRTEAEVHAIRARRAMLEANMRVEGTPEPMIERLATDGVAARMLDHERQITDMITNLFGSR